MAVSEAQAQSGAGSPSGEAWRPWDAPAAAAEPELEGLLYASRLIGADQRLVVWGGGNTSAKVEERDFRGRPVTVLRVKGSGSDLRTIAPRDFPGVRLDDVLPLREREAMSDEEMVAYLAHTLMEPTSPRPSIETLLHAFIPAKYVFHTHADAILSLTNTPHGRRWVEEALGPGAVWIPYQRPGFALSKSIADLLAAHTNATCAVMEKHGLITWGDTAQAAYEATIQAVTRADAFAARTSPRAERELGGEVSPDARQRLYVALAPLLRGLAARTTSEGTLLPVGDPRGLTPSSRVILRFDDSREVLDFVNDPEAARLSQIGPATPDHLVSTKRWPLFVPAATSDDEAATLAALREALEPAWLEWVQRYKQYVQEGARKEGRDVSGADLRPRVALLPGVGMVTLGKDARAARSQADIYHHAIATIRAAERVESYESLGAQECFDVEYWPLELYKLTLAPPEKALARRVALVTGGGSGIGRAIAHRLAAEGAHVVILDLNAKGAATVTEEIVQANGEGRAVAVTADVSDEAAVQRAYTDAIRAYGGVDILVSNAGLARSHPVEDTPLPEWDLLLGVLGRGYFLVAREAFRTFKAQGVGGCIVFIASKNALVAGRDNTAYSAAKAAELHLARCLAEEGGPVGIRVNTVCPDAVLQGSAIWTAEWREERARTYGIAPNQLEEFYRKRTTLKVNIYPEDIAEATFFFISDRAAKTTGGVLTVDGGVPAAYVR